jgi:hypothetical protein
MTKQHEDPKRPRPDEQTWSSGGQAPELSDHSEVVQAQRHHPELNLGDSEEEAAAAPEDRGADDE